MEPATNSTWHFPTLKSVEQLEGNPLVKCGCGRWQSADMLVDVRALPMALRQKLAHRADYACDGCRQELVLRGHTTMSEVARHLGAPADVVSRIQAKERA